MSDNNSSLNILRITGLLEGISYLLLLGVCMPLKYLAEIHAPNKLVGMAHGLLFVLYCILVILNRANYNWSFTKTFWALIASILPFGTFVADAKIFKKELSS